MEGIWLASYVALWAMMLVQAIVIAALLRQVGILHLRIGPVGARTTNMGLEIGASLPNLNVDDINGSPVSLVDRERARLLVFIVPGCGICDELMPAVRTMVRSERDRLSIILITGDEEEETARSFIRKHHLDAIPFVLSAQVASACQVRSAPYALAIDTDGVVRAKGMISHIEHLESIVEALSAGHPTMESYVITGNRRGGHGE